MPSRPPRIRLSLAETTSLVTSYAWRKIRDQARSVLLIVVYLVLFQTFVLRMPLRDALTLALGIGIVVIGLAVFLEGLLLGLMPLGEQIGIEMPRKWRLPLILAFALVLGPAATLAEPAIGVLRAAGSTVNPWDAPLLYALLNRYSSLLVAAIAAGVGLATVLSMLRFRFDWSLKPIAIALSAAAVVLSLVGMGEPNLRHIAGLAWDSGGIATGPVTVPLVLALGIGICRSVGTNDNPTAGFGVVTLASLLPTLAVTVLALVLAHQVPAPMSREAFCDPGNLASVARLYASEAEAQEAQARASGTAATPTSEAHTALSAVREVLRRTAGSALQAVLPLSLFLLLVLFLALREKLPHADEVFLGIALALVGMGLLQGGLELGLTRLGSEVGARLPAAFDVTPMEEQTVLIRGFTRDAVQRTILPTGEIRDSFLTYDGDRLVAVPFDPSRYDAEQGTYRYTPSRTPLVGANRRIAGFALVILFAFVLGYAATFAEPALAALGVTVEELSVGTFRKAALIRAVALGVGLGTASGVARLLWHVPLAVLLAPPYLIAALLTLVSTEDYVNVAWDSAGVATGPVIVPLVVAMGLGIGGQVGITEGFGVVSLASVYPVLTVLLTGLRVAARERRLKGR